MSVIICTKYNLSILSYVVANVSVEITYLMRRNAPLEKVQSNTLPDI